MAATICTAMVIANRLITNLLTTNRRITDHIAAGCASVAMITTAIVAAIAYGDVDKQFKD